MICPQTPMDNVRNAICDAAALGVDFYDFAFASEYASTTEELADGVRLLALSCPDPAEEHGIDAFRASVLDGPVQAWCLQWV